MEYRFPNRVSPSARTAHALTLPLHALSLFPAGDYLQLAQYHGHGFVSDAAFDAANAACGNWTQRTQACTTAARAAANQVGGDIDVCVVAQARRRGVALTRNPFVGPMSLTIHCRRRATSRLPASVLTPPPRPSAHPRPS